jgi:hypothetical protein
VIEDVSEAIAVTTKGCAHVRFLLKSTDFNVENNTARNSGFAFVALIVDTNAVNSAGEISFMLIESMTSADWNGLVC